METSKNAKLCVTLYLQNAYLLQLRAFTLGFFEAR